MSRKKSILKVYSVYDKVSNSYPYYPTLYRSNMSAYLNFLNFTRGCNNPDDFELHYIGTAQYDKNNLVTGVQPNFYVYRVEFDKNNRVIALAINFDKLARKARENLDHFFSLLFT